MASKTDDCEFEILSDEEPYPDGHEIHCCMPVQYGTAGVEVKSFMLDFSTTCEVPSSWIVRFFYKKLPETGKINCTVSLSRTDNGKHTMQAFALVTFFDFQGHVARFSQVVCTGPVPSGGTIQGDIRDEDNSEIINQRLRVIIALNIYNCHGQF
ncbi:hypothetical protein HNY73_010499 [Argiope bruennichi]|uniref:Uncharacterized protein n=1 Tax=Argiope bruennichi TaxID=94029 RepID=A0A8T0F1C1_ARGBR|nr:hypothetical protein HNY73_010499 [Argiope bruennichi]